MNTIYKYELKITDEQKISVPYGATILDIEFQVTTHNLCMWCMVNPDTKMKAEIKLRIVGTGHDFEKPNNYVYLKTVQQAFLVWHIFLDTTETNMNINANFEEFLKRQG
jgi:hypothetical protein